MLYCARLENERGKSLNALEFPLPESDFRPLPFSSETYAWRTTNGMMLCGSNSEPFPVRDLRWGLVATSGAHHWLHIDSDGFGTFLDVKVGIKLWLLGRPKLGQNDPCHKGFASTSIFLSPDFDVNIPCLELWDWEAVVLTPGTRL